MNSTRTSSAVQCYCGENTALQYNDENSLACAIRIAFYTSYKHYTLFRELPTGEGFADIVYIPKKKSEYPAILIELKYNLP